MSQRNISKIARAEAVSQLSSTEQLDQRLVVVRGSAWIAVLVGVLLLTLAIAWGWFGRLPNVVTGQGVIAPAGTQPIDVSSPSASGGVVEVVVPVGQHLKAGDVILRLSNADLEEQLSEATDRVEFLRKQDEQLTKAEDRVLDRRKASLDAQLAAATLTTAQTKQLADMVKAEIQDLEALVDQKLVPRAQLVSTRQSYFTILQEISQQDTLVAQANAEYDSLVTQTEQQRMTRAGALASARDDVQQLRTRFDSATVVRAPIDAVVLGHMVDLGSTVEVGTAVVDLRPASDAVGSEPDLMATAYVPYATGRLITAGMEVQVSLPFAHPSRYGYILGTVERVSTYVSGNAAAVHLGSPDLAREMSQQIGPMLEVILKLEADESTATGLRWTSAGGFPKALEFPALCGVRVLVSQDRPIDLVLPWLKDALGLDPAPPVVGDGTP